MKPLTLAGVVLLGFGMAGSPAAAGEEPSGRAYVMKGALRGGPALLEDVVLNIGFGRRLGERLFLDIVHKNEGHAEEGHRDGFGGELFYELYRGSRWSVELGGGLLWTFNTTDPDGVEINEKRLAGIASAALLWRAGRRVALRAQYDLVKAPGAFSTQTAQIGVQYDFDAPTPPAAEQSVPLELTVGGGLNKMNTGRASGSLVMLAELRRRLGPHLACSASVLRESDNHVSRRDALAAQCWYLQQVSDRWRMGAAAGPALTQDDKEGSDHYRLGALISLEAARRTGRDSEIGVRFNRLAVRTEEARDADHGILFVRVRLP